MYCCSLKFILIVIVFNCRHSSGYQASDDKSTSSKTNSIFMFCIGGGILVALLLLIGLVFSLYLKVDKALKASKAPVCWALKGNPFTVTQDKIAEASSVTPESYPSRPRYDERHLYNDLDALPPCFCDVNEGL